MLWNFNKLKIPQIYTAVKHTITLCLCRSKKGFEFRAFKLLFLKEPLRNPVKLVDVLLKQGLSLVVCRIDNAFDFIRCLCH